MLTNLEKISDAFVSARLDGRALPVFPGELPATMEEGYQLQDRSISIWPDTVAGWKIGLVPPDFRAQIGAERLVGPIFSKLIVRDEPGRRHKMPVFAGGFAAIEAEFVFELRRDFPASVEIDTRLVHDLVGDLHIGVEIASSPFRGINDLGPLCVISDFGNNHGLVVGPKIENWSSLDWSDIPAAVTIDGQVAGEANAAAIPGGPTGAVRFILQLMRDRGVSMPAGTLISTGAVTGVHAAPIGARSQVDFGRFGTIEVELTRYEGLARADQAVHADQGV